MECFLKVINTIREEKERRKIVSLNERKEREGERKEIMYVGGVNAA
jgi:hypothetical protein